MIIGIGIDIVEIDRIQGQLKLHGEKFFQRIFTDWEIAACRARARPMQHFAGRFAAKEAAFKALGTGVASGVSWKSVELVNEPSGRPVLRLGGAAAKRMKQIGAKTAWVSVSHGLNHAVATVVLEA